METAEDLSAAEQFWTTYADLPIPGTYSTTDPEIPPSRWIVLGYDLYGVPDESSFEQRTPLSEVNLSHIGGPVVVGGDGQDELRTDVHIGAIRIKSRIAPISLWLKSNQTTMTSRIPVAGPLRMAYPPYVFLMLGSHHRLAVISTFRMFTDQGSLRYYHHRNSIFDMAILGMIVVLRIHASATSRRM